MNRAGPPPHQARIDARLGRLAPRRLGLAAAGNVTRPAAVRGLEGVPVTAASAGESHSLFVSAAGAVYACGRNHRGQAGRPGASAAALSAAGPMAGLDGVHAVGAAAGDEHSLVVAADGDVFACGANAYGQLVPAGPSSIIGPPIPPTYL
jgi:alpha-tubulin suppressor-like RCC1 family protein